MEAIGEKRNEFGQLLDASFRPFFPTQFMDRRTDQQAYLPEVIQLYISVMFRVLPDDIHEENLHFCNLEKNALRTDRRTDRPKEVIFLIQKTSFLMLFSIHRYILSGTAGDVTSCRSSQFSSGLMKSLDIHVYLSEIKFHSLHSFLCPATLGFPISYSA